MPLSSTSPQMKRTTDTVPQSKLHLNSTDLNSTQESASTFESDTEEAFVVESNQKENSEDYYEEPDSPR